MAAFVFRLPDIGEGTTEAEIAAWHVEVGSVIREEEPLLDLTTNKATVEVTSPVQGVVTERHGEVGDVRAIGSHLLVIETGAGDGTAPAAATPGPGTDAPQAAAPVPAPAAPLVREPNPAPAEAPARPLASPALRQRAAGRGIDLALVQGSGPEGRVTDADLERHARPSPTVPAPAPATGITEVRIVGVRRVIAERLQEAKRRIPHFSYVEEVDVTALEALRATLNAGAGAAGRLTVLPFLVLALARALPDFPNLNARFDDHNGILRQHAAVHVGIATQTPSGLLVPVLRDAGTLDLGGAAAGIRRLAEGARTAKLKAEELSGSTITISSLGPLGGLVSTPVINAPETAIVGVNRIAERPMVMGGQVVIRAMMNLSSSFDHRIVDGVEAARFIQALKALLEQPALLFMPRP